jgi:hydroxymethylpyrimidine/phosphomethylpyrimidine kinase
VGDQPIAGVKIGMLGTAEAVGVVAHFLRHAGIPQDRIVLDPVLRASSGPELLEPEGVRRLVSDLLPLVGWVTPNLDELAALLSTPARSTPISPSPAPTRDSIPLLAASLASLGSPALNVVVTGGHLDPPDDFLRTAAGQGHWFPGQRIEPRSIHGSHGTGCAFSSALLCRLLLGDPPLEAVAAAKAWVVRRLEGW